jgi:hypothetical protein
MQRRQGAFGHILTLGPKVGATMLMGRLIRVFLSQLVTWNGSRTAEAASTKEEFGLFKVGPCVPKVTQLGWSAPSHSKSMANRSRKMLPVASPWLNYNG